MDELYLSKIIKQKRKEHRFTQQDLAMYSGVSIATIRAIEQGTSNVNILTLNKILNLFSLKLIVSEVNE